MEQADQPLIELDSDTSDSTIAHGEKEVKKKIPLLPIILIFVLLLASIGGYFILSKSGNKSGTKGSSAVKEVNIKDVKGFDVTKDIAYSPTEFMYGTADTSDAFWVYGYYKNSVFGGQLVETPDSDDYAMFNMKNAEGIDEIKDGDFVVVRARFGNEDGAPIADYIAKIPVEYVDTFNLYKYPYADITILDAPKQVTHGCEFLKLKVRIKNTGKIPIRKSDFYTFSTELPKYKFIHIVDGYEDGGYSYDEETKDIYHQGYLNFEDIQPGETKEFMYGLGGGLVSDCPEGGVYCAWKGGSPNIFCDAGASSPGGDREIKLAIGYLKPGSYTENILTSVSNSVTINVLTCECDLDADH